MHDWSNVAERSDLVVGLPKSEGEALEVWRGRDDAGLNCWSGRATGKGKCVDTGEGGGRGGDGKRERERVECEGEIETKEEEAQEQGRYE